MGSLRKPAWLAFQRKLGKMAENQLTRASGNNVVVINNSGGLTRTKTGDIVHEFMRDEGDSRSAISSAQSLTQSGNAGLTTVQLVGGSAAAGALAWMMFGPGLVLAGVGLVAFLLWSSSGKKAAS